MKYPELTKDFKGNNFHGWIIVPSRDYNPFVVCLAENINCLKAPIASQVEKLGDGDQMIHAKIIGNL
jgi:hypothetical protein